MADNALDKIKDQCLELILEIVPASQVVFLIFACAVTTQLSKGAGNTVFDALTQVSLKDLFSLDMGILWALNLKNLMLILVLAFVNTWIFKSAIKRSFRRSRIEQSLPDWMSAAVSSLKDYSEEEKKSVTKSISTELTERMRRYSSLRLLFELVMSLVVLILYGSSLLVFVEGIKGVVLIAYDSLVLLISLALAVAMHVASIRYAIEKILPLQVYLSAASGEISFFRGMD